MGEELGKGEKEGKENLAEGGQREEALSQGQRQVTRRWGGFAMCYTQCIILPLLTKPSGKLTPFANEFCYFFDVMQWCAVFKVCGLSRGRLNAPPTRGLHWYEVPCNIFSPNIARKQYVLPNKSVCFFLPNENYSIWFTECFVYLFSFG